MNAIRNYKSKVPFLAYETITFDNDGAPETLESDMPKRYEAGEYLTESGYTIPPLLNRLLLMTHDGLYAWIMSRDVEPFLVNEGETIDEAWQRLERFNERGKRAFALSLEADKIVADTTDYGADSAEQMANALRLAMRCTPAQARRAIRLAIEDVDGRALSGDTGPGRGGAREGAGRPAKEQAK